jgi:hypothetical protein
LSDRPPLLDALDRVLRFLSARRIDYMLLGGMAVRTLSIPRPTYDLDLMVAVRVEDVGRFAGWAQEEGWLVGEEHLRGFVDRLRGLAKLAVSIPVGERTIPVDLFVLGSEYQRAAFDRRALHATDLGEVSLISAEDLLLHKLLADRPRDRADIADLLAVTGPLDADYLRGWAARLGVEGALGRALREAGRPEAS